MALSDAALRSMLGKEYEKVQVKTDRDGLSVRISRKGRITFQYRYRWNGQGEPVDIGIRPEAATHSPKGDKWGTADDLKAAEWMFSRVKIITPTAKAPNWPAWANEVRLLRGSLDVTHHDICETFRWANADHFWQTNILSPAKLRAKWDILRAQMSQPGRNRQAVAQQPAQHWNSREAWENEFL